MRSIIRKYLEGTASGQEQKKLLDWLNEKENRIVFHSTKSNWRKSLEDDYFPLNGSKVWSSIQTGLFEKSYQRWQSARKLNQVFRYAAIFFFLCTLGIFTWYFFNESRPVPSFYTTVVAEKGQISKVELPDGSEVWLNSGTELSYDNNFASLNRSLILKGEAYFDVARNTKIPMVVNLGEFHVKVTGTQFNVSCYGTNSFVEVVLEEGAVELLKPDDESFIYRMNPGEQARFDKDKRKLVVADVNTGKFTAWKDGIINIYDQTLAELVKRLETRYNQKFIYADEVKNFKYTFTITTERLDEIIHLMERITPVKAIQHNEVIEFILDEKKKQKAERR